MVTVVAIRAVAFPGRGGGGYVTYVTVETNQKILLLLYHTVQLLHKNTVIWTQIQIVSYKYRHKYK